MTRQVYFLGHPGGPVKIGVSNDPEQRRRQIQTGYPSPLFLLAHTNGDEEDERRLHAIFRKFRMKGEWFEPAPELMMLVWAVAARGPDAGIPFHWMAADKPLKNVLELRDSVGTRGIAAVLRQDARFSGRQSKLAAGLLASAADKQRAEQRAEWVKSFYDGIDPSLPFGDRFLIASLRAYPEEGNRAS